MAHECPICYMNCHCGGDIDDICMDGTDEQLHCTHCSDEDYEDDDWSRADEGSWGCDDEEDEPEQIS